ncbi:MAG: Rieske 2Fe-2S domain-containing protein [Acidobacteria bacterium]|nr:Rieske 2Fe-2S domain-containing protein [Acidobacteriota bacterium]
MKTQTALDVITDRNFLETTAEAVQPAILNTFKTGGEPGQKIKNALHGTWLGHPLHPALTDIPLGAWTAALVFDLMAEADGAANPKAAADVAITVGLAGAAGAAVTGLTDWSATGGSARRSGLLHGLLNVGATALYGASLWRRSAGDRRNGRTLAYAGYAVSAMAAYLGGHLVFSEQVGVNHTAQLELPSRFTAVMDEHDLPEGVLHRAEVDGVGVLLVRTNGTIHALAETCSHAGGPLAEGKLINGSVQCPWHASRFALDDGRVLDGPSTFSQPCFEVQVRDGQIEVRAAGGG